MDSALSTRKGEKPQATPLTPRPALEIHFVHGAKDGEGDLAVVGVLARIDAGGAGGILERIRTTH